MQNFTEATQQKENISLAGVPAYNQAKSIEYVLVLDREKDLFLTEPYQARVEDTMLGNMPHIVCIQQDIENIDTCFESKSKDSSIAKTTVEVLHKMIPVIEEQKAADSFCFIFTLKFYLDFWFTTITDHVKRPVFHI
ncbi:hypothetical protein QYM36_012789 [Artemia franciscana]|uniref:Uncharacterized protein n=1 Tax=Artemia franciscana TaxID=6661 RepID=A0AA88HK25_ARTSF|nr:hypothetical protein QYM36_012789 [Artemia franciscana]